MLALLTLTGCSIEQRLARTSENIEDLYAKAREWEELPLRVISWNQALAMIYNNNIELKQVSSTIARYEREGLSIYTDMIPGLSYYGYMTQALGDIFGPYSGSDVNTNVNMTFNLPTITNIPYRVYAARANTFAAMKTKEFKERELISKIYKEVRSREIELKKRALANSRPDMNEQTKMLNESSNRLADANYWKSVADVLGDYTARWQILPESMPRVKWSVYSKKLNRLDPLTICRFAVRLEQARLSQYGIALQYLPTINANLYSPSLFSSYGGTYQGSFLDGDDTNINLNISYTLDTKLSIWNSYRDRKENYENIKHEVEASVIDHKHKLTQLRRSVSDYYSWRSYMNKRIRYIQESPVSTADEQLLRDTSVLDMKAEMLNQEGKSVESETALILEYGLMEK